MFRLPTAMSPGYVRSMHFAATNNRNANNHTPTRRVGD
jgi:hypothetical protein